MRFIEGAKVQLTLFTRHALSVLVHLARRPQRLSTIAEVARTYGISRYHLMKIVSELSKAGFVEAVRGRKGGIRIARSPGEITLGDVVRHTEAGMAPAENDPEATSGLKLLAEAVGQAFASFLATLDRTTLHDVANIQDASCGSG